MKDSELKAFNYAKKICDFAHLVFLESKEDSVEIINNKIKKFENTVNRSIYLHVWIDGKKGSCVVSELTKPIVENAIKLAKSSKKLDYFEGLPGPRKYPRVNIFDRKISEMSERSFLEFNKDIIKNVATKNTFISSASTSKETSFLRVINSEGIDASFKKTFLISYTSVVAKKYLNQATFSVENSSVRYFHPDYAKEAKEKAKFYLKQKKIKKIPKIVILKPKVFSELLDEAFLPNLTSQAIIQNRSIFLDKINKKCLSNITMRDNRIMDYGLYSSPFDYEGFPSGDTVLFENGILRNIITDYNDAKKLNIKPTGNASKDGAEFSNVIIKGDYNDIDEALVVDNIIGAHTSNDITGDFSVAVGNAYIIKNQRKEPVKDLMLSGNILEVLQNYISIGKEIEQHNGIYTGAIATDKLAVIKKK